MEAHAEPLRVLVVDDEPSIVDVISMALRYEGFEVRRVTFAANLYPHQVHIGRILVKVDGIAHFAEVAPQLVFFSPNDREFEDGQRSGSENQQNRRRGMPPTYKTMH